jgi:hypothetical protein
MSNRTSMCQVWRGMRTNGALAVLRRPESPSGESDSDMGMGYAEIWCTKQNFRCPTGGGEPDEVLYD